MFDLVKCVDENIYSQCFTCVPGRDEFRFGDYKDLNKTKKALMSGIVPDKVLSMYEKVKEAIEGEFPELLELQMLAVKSRRKRKFSEEGDELDIDRYMSGDIECWQSMESIKDKKTIRLFYNMSLSARNEALKFIENICLCIVFMELIKTLGIVVEFYCGSIAKEVSSSSNKTVVLSMVKPADEEIDCQQLLALGAPGLYRYFNFNLWKNLLPGKIDKGLGYPSYELPQWLNDEFQFDILVHAAESKTKLAKAFIDKVKFLLQ